MSKDAIKEALDDAVSVPSRTLEWSRALGAASYEAMWVIAVGLSEAVLEANFYPDSDPHRRAILALHPSPVEVYCACPPEEARRRYLARAKERHPVHVDVDLSLERFRTWDRPIALGPVITVDTTKPVDVEAVAQAVSRTQPS